LNRQGAKNAKKGNGFSRTYLKIPADVRVTPDVIPARPPWMAEVLETQEQFPVHAGIQYFQVIFWMPASAGMTNKLPRTELEIGSNKKLGVLGVLAVNFLAYRF
jgi:hypothetical protein